MTENYIGIIGGSGFYNFVENGKIGKLSTPYGEVEYESGTIGNKSVVFIPRHGKSHSIPPSEINYRANIFAMKSFNVDVPSPEIA